MNYLAHACRFLGDPYFVAGTALPDWMSVIDRKNRARKQYAEPVTLDEDPEIAAFARGCIQHHDDDHWFHGQQQFVMLSTQFAIEVRQLLDKGLGHQAGFVGHILVELLLDSVLIEDNPQILVDYYQHLDSLDPARVQLAANKICQRPVTLLEVLIPRFIQERFLADYVDDQALVMRLNQVMNRVRLPRLPTSFAHWLPSARPRVRAVATDLLR